jgi:hypothetical protein
MAQWPPAQPFYRVGLDGRVMTFLKVLPAALLLLALVPHGSAVPTTAAADCAAPPCGYIVPQLALDFPDKPTCRAASLGAAVDLSTCLVLPAEGESVVQEGMLRWYWDITQDGTYPADPAQPIVIGFSGTATNPSWMEISVEPASFTLDAVALVNPTNMRQGEGAQLWFWFESPITVTLTRTGSPDEAGQGKIDNAGGVAKVFLKAKSTASGAYFKEAFGVEEFRFNAYADPALKPADAKGAPALSPLLLLGALAVLAGLLRRRAA